jgi:hypothetical protein
MVAGFSNGSAVIAPTERSQALCTIKSDFLDLIHQADVVVNGRSIEQCQPFINIARHFQLISEMSENDLKTLGHSIGFTETVHGRARAPSRQTLLVAANEVPSRVAPRGGTNLFFIFSNGNF